MLWDFFKSKIFEGVNYMPKLFEEQTNKGFEFVGAMGKIIEHKCNNCSFTFKTNAAAGKQKVICPQCGNV